eukprot:tig00000076_g2362.t1
MRVLVPASVVVVLLLSTALGSQPAAPEVVEADAHHMRGPHVEAAHHSASAQTEARAKKDVDMQVVFAQVIIRHGDRTPLTLLPGDDVVWKCEPNFLSSPIVRTEDSDAGASYVYEKVYMKGKEKLRGNCPMGELTNIGIAQHLKLGGEYRKRYVDQYGLLSPQLKEGEIFVRSTDIQRTQQSAQSFLRGLYPAAERPAGSIIRIHTAEILNEYICTPPYIADPDPSGYGASPVDCPAIGEMQDELRRSEPWRKRDEAMQPIAEKLKSVLGLRDLPGWMALHDAFTCRLSHGKPLPEGVTDDIVSRVRDQASFELGQRFGTEKLARLGIGRLVGEVVSALRAAAEGRPGPRFILYSGHDTSVAPFLSAFKAYDGKAWPPYASHVSLELLVNADGDYFVRLSFLGRELALDVCEGVTPCPLLRFLEYAARVTPADWDAECGIDPEPKAVDLISDRPRKGTKQPTKPARAAQSEPEPAEPAPAALVDGTEAASREGPSSPPSL